jgi:hypothetical protein
VLYESFLERDVAAIRGAIRDYRSSHSIEELFSEVARFAVLAYAPSQHGKHAVLSCLSSHDLGLSDDLLMECAIYAAGSRQPWSEPPITTPPDRAERTGIEELRAAIEEGDRLRGERWLSARLDDSIDDLYLAAADDFEDLGHKLIVTAAAVRLAAIFPSEARFATLRLAVWEMTAYRGERYEEQGVALDPETLLADLIEAMVASKGDIISSHAIFLLDAALQTENEMVMRRVRDYLSTIVQHAALGTQHFEGGGEPPRSKAYPFARDYGSFLKCHAVAKRMRSRFPKLDFDAMLRASAWNLDHAPSFEEFSFA